MKVGKKIVTMGLVAALLASMIGCSGVSMNSSDNGKAAGATDPVI